MSFSDQQIATGLGVLVAGFAQQPGGLAQSPKGPSLYHWWVVLYFAWLTSTVRLISLSSIRARLSRSRALRNFRLVLIIFVLGILFVALAPFRWGVLLGGASPHVLHSFLVGCPWGDPAAWAVTQIERSEMKVVNIDTALSYTTLVIAYTMVLGNFFQAVGCGHNH